MLDSEQIHHPDHYNWFDIECVDVAENFTYNLGSAIKYIWRSGHKDNAVIDLHKAIWHINREIDSIEKDNV